MTLGSSTGSTALPRWAEARSEAAGAPPLPPRFRRRKPVRGPGRTQIVLNVTAMIDVVFLLMTYFLLIAQFRSAERGLPLGLPRKLESSAASASPRDPFELPARPLTVLVRSTGPARSDMSVSVDDPAIPRSNSLEELVSNLTSARGVSLPADQLIAVRPAPDARWEHAVVVFSALRQAGFDAIRLSNPVPATPVTPPTPPRQ